MESWRKVWRDGLEPLLSAGSLEALRRGLANDDPNQRLDGISECPLLSRPTHQLATS